LESAPEVALLPRVAEAGEAHVRLRGAVEPEEAADRLRAAHRHDRDALGGEIAAAPACERLERDPVAHAFDEHDGTRIGGSTARPLGHGSGGAPSPSTQSAR